MTLFFKNKKFNIIGSLEGKKKLLNKYFKIATI